MTVVVMALAIAFLFGTPVNGQVGKITRLTESVKHGATCLDGSPAAYYFVPGTDSGKDKWFVWHEGGGWCSSTEDCYGRSRGELGSSVHYPEELSMDQGYFSGDARVNPMMHNWNKVLIRYCDGGSYAGNATERYQNDSVDVVLHYQGKAILYAVRDSLYGIGAKDATDVVISGCSAGGLAVYLHLDWWREMLPPAAHVAGMADSGFFVEYESSVGHFILRMIWTFYHQNVTGGINEGCIRNYTKEPWRCIFAQHVAPFIKTPLFALQSEYDEWQIENILNDRNPEVINEWGKNITHLISTRLIQSPTHANGVFLDSCYHHCGEWGIDIRGVNQAMAFARWFDNNRDAQKVFYQDKVYPCKDCCAPKQQQDTSA